MKKCLIVNNSLFILMLIFSPIKLSAQYDVGKGITITSYFGNVSFAMEDDFLKQTPISNGSNPIRNVQLSTNSVIDSLIYSVSGTSYKETFSYNSEGKILTTKKEILTINWENHSLATFTYNDSGFILTELYENWDNFSGSWESGNRKSSVYDAYGNKLTYLYEDWDSAAEQWKNDRNYVYTYDENGNPLTYKLEKWNTDSQSWQEDWFVTSTYDEDDNLLTQVWEIVLVTRQDWSYTFTYDSTGKKLSYLQEVKEPYTSEWVQSYRYIYTYDENENLLIDQSEFWDKYNSIWITGTRNVYTYDSEGNLLTDLSESPDFSTELWRGSYRSFYTYGDNRNILTSFTEKWDILDSSWADYSRSNYDYSEMGDFIYFSNETWNGANWSPSNKILEFENNGQPFSYTCEELSTYHSILTDLDDLIINSLPTFALFQNYPNPFNPSTTIKYRIAENAPVELSVFNILGQKVFTLFAGKQIAGSYQVSWDASTFSSGLYIYKLKTPTKTFTHRMLLIK